MANHQVILAEINGCQLEIGLWENGVTEWNDGLWENGVTEWNEFYTARDQLLRCEQEQDVYSDPSDNVQGRLTLRLYLTA